MTHRTGEYDDGMEGFAVGTATTLSADGARPQRPREFPPGFAGANPGPSHDDDAPPTPRRRARPAQPKGQTP